jgi:hypothetical protein
VRAPDPNWRLLMLDAAFFAIGFAFLGAALLYVVVCDHL